MQALVHVTYHRRSIKYLSTRNSSRYLIFVVKQRASSGVPQGVLLLKVLNFLQHRKLLALTFYDLVVVTSFSLTRSILTFFFLKIIITILFVGLYYCWFSSIFKSFRCY